MFNMQAYLSSSLANPMAVPQWPKASLVQLPFSRAKCLHPFMNNKEGLLEDYHSEPYFWLAGGGRERKGRFWLFGFFCLGGVTYSGGGQNLRVQAF